MKKEHIIIRVSADEKDAFKKASEISGQSLSAWARLTLRDKCSKVLKESNIEIPFLKINKQ